MGLDNGFTLRNVDKTTIPKFIRYNDSYMPENEVELVYWRKCWGLRKVVMSVLHMWDQDYCKQVEAEDIPAILRELYPFLSKEYWEENADSIWTFDEMIESFTHDILNLAWLEGYMKEHPEVTCEFYDSY